MGIGLVHLIIEWLKEHRSKYERFEPSEFCDELGKSDGLKSHFYVILSQEGPPFTESIGAKLKEII